MSQQTPGKASHCLLTGKLQDNFQLLDAIQTGTKIVDQLKSAHCGKVASERRMSRLHLDQTREFILERPWTNLQIVETVDLVFAER